MNYHFIRERMSTSYQVKEISSDKRKEYEANKNNRKDYQIIEQAILVGLLNRIYGFDIVRTTKKSQLTMNNFRIRNIGVGRDVVNIYDFAHDQCIYFYEKKATCNIKRQTVLKSFEKNRRMFVMNYLIDLAMESGFFFNFVKVNKFKKDSVNVDTFNAVYYHGKLLLSENDIIEKGKLINQYLLNRLNHAFTLKLEPNDSQLSNILFN